jgi:hypothetical protein
MKIELGALSGRPNSTWELNDAQTREFRSKFSNEPTLSDRATTGLGFKVEGFRDDDEVTVWNELVDANREGKEYNWLDEGRTLERYFAMQRGRLLAALQRTTGLFGNYLSELEAQPGGPCGWPNKKPGSRPKNVLGQPHGERLAARAAVLSPKRSPVPSPGAMQWNMPAVRGQGARSVKAAATRQPMVHTW